jgi:hypothetical protein
MEDWSLEKLLGSLHQDIQQRLTIARESFKHPGTKGDASESIWLELLQKYLPHRYQCMKAHVVDSVGNFSQQIDIVVFDRQYTPFIFNFEGLAIIPAESVYAVFEAKQDISANQISYAQNKAASVRNLHRTSLPIPHAGGTYPPKQPVNIIAGILALESNWTPPMGEPMMKALNTEVVNGHLDLGCVAAHGAFKFNSTTKSYEVSDHAKHATTFLFDLITLLQNSATVPMIDIKAYAEWLTK